MREREVDDERIIRCKKRRKVTRTSDKRKKAMQ